MGARPTSPKSATLPASRVPRPTSHVRRPAPAREMTRLRHRPPTPAHSTTQHAPAVAEAHYWRMPSRARQFQRQPSGTNSKCHVIASRAVTADLQCSNLLPLEPRREKTTPLAILNQGGQSQIFARYKAFCHTLRSLTNALSVWLCQ